jgi:hypothetical protein
VRTVTLSSIPGPGRCGSAPAPPRRPAGARRCWSAPCPATWSRCSSAHPSAIGPPQSWASSTTGPSSPSASVSRPRSSIRRASRRSVPVRSEYPMSRWSTATTRQPAGGSAEHPRNAYDQVGLPWTHSTVPVRPGCPRLGRAGVQHVPGALAVRRTRRRPSGPASCWSLLSRGQPVGTCQVPPARPRPAVTGHLGSSPGSAGGRLTTRISLARMLMPEPMPPITTDCPGADVLLVQREGGRDRGGADVAAVREGQRDPLRVDAELLAHQLGVHRGDLVQDVVVGVAAQSQPLSRAAIQVASATPSPASSSALVSVRMWSMEPMHRSLCSVPARDSPPSSGGRPGGPRPARAPSPHRRSPASATRTRRRRPRRWSPRRRGVPAWPPGGPGCPHRPRSARTGSDPSRSWSRRGASR